MSTFSSSPFGAPSPPPAPAAPPAPVAVEEPARRSRTYLLGGAGAAALLVVAGLAVALTGGDPVDDAALAPPPPVAAPETPAPEPTEPVALPTQQLSARDPFVPLVTEPAAATASAGAPAPSGGTGGGGVPGSAPPGPVPTGSSGAPPAGAGSTAPTTAGPAPASTTGGPPGAVETCKRADEIWTAYIKAMADETLTETMAGHELGIRVRELDLLAESTAVAALRQPLRAWSLETGEVRALLVEKKAVRPPKPVPETRPDPVYVQPAPGALPAVDEDDILTARTAQRERCYQLIDPLVAPEEF